MQPRFITTLLHLVQNLGSNFQYDDAVSTQTLVYALLGVAETRILLPMLITIDCISSSPSLICNWIFLGCIPTESSEDAANTGAITR